MTDRRPDVYCSVCKDYQHSLDPLDIPPNDYVCRNCEAEKPSALELALRDYKKGGD